MALCFSQPFLRGKLPFYGNTIASSVLWRLVWRKADRRCDEFWISGCCPSYRGAQLIRLLAEVGKRKKEKGQRELSFPLFPFICPPIWSKVFDFYKRSIDFNIATAVIPLVALPRFEPQIVVDPLQV